MNWNRFISLIHFIHITVCKVICTSRVATDERRANKHKKVDERARLMLTLFSRKINFLNCRPSPFMDENRVHCFTS